MYLHLALLLLFETISSGLSWGKWDDCSQIVLDANLDGSAKVTYDISRFMLAQNSNKPYYQIHKTEETNAQGTYDFYFNVCADTPQIPLADVAGSEHCCAQSSWNKGADDNTLPAGMHAEQTGFIPLGNLSPGVPLVMSGYTPAWQVEVNADGICTRCNRLGRSQADTGADHGGLGLVNEQGEVNFGLIDDGHPTNGVFVEYTQGDTGAYTSGTGADSQYGCLNGNRKFKLKFICAPEHDINTAHVLDVENQPVYEETQCEYFTTFKTPAGCPIECPHSSNEGGTMTMLCNGHGHCELDAGMKRPRCFCDIGWSGTGCTDSTPAEVAMATDYCLMISGSGGGYVKGVCDDSGEHFIGVHYSDPACSKEINQAQSFPVKTCTNVFGKRVGIECLSSGGPAIFRASYCINLGATNTTSSGVQAWVVVVCILLILVLGSVAYLVHKQQNMPDLNNFLVLNDDHTTQL